MKVSTCLFNSAFLVAEMYCNLLCGVRYKLILLVVSVTCYINVFFFILIETVCMYVGGHCFYCIIAISNHRANFLEDNHDTIFF